MSQQANLKGIVHAKMITRSLFTQPHIFIKFRKQFYVKGAVTFTVQQNFTSEIQLFQYEYMRLVGNFEKDFSPTEISQQIQVGRADSPH